MRNDGKRKSTKNSENNSTHHETLETQRVRQPLPRPLTATVIVIDGCMPPLAVPNAVYVDPLEVSNLYVAIPYPQLAPLPERLMVPRSPTEPSYGPPSFIVYVA